MVVPFNSCDIRLSREKGKKLLEIKLIGCPLTVL